MKSLRLIVNKDDILSFILGLTLFATMFLSVSRGFPLLVVVVLLIRFVKGHKSRYNTAKLNRDTCIYLGLFVLLSFIQKLVCGYDAVEWISNFPTLIALCGGPCVMIIFGSNFFNSKIVLKALICFNTFFSLYCIVAEIKKGLSIERTSAFGTVSKNYTSAIIYFGVPLVLMVIYLTPLQKVRRRYQLLILQMVMAILLASSRTAFAIILCMLLSLFVVGKKTGDKYLKYLLTCLIAMFALLILSSMNESIKEMLERVLSIFETTEDSARTILRSTGLSTFQSRDFAEKLFGSGNSVIYAYRSNTYPHNFFIEILLSNGIIGTLLLGGYSTYVFVHYINNINNTQKVFMIQIAGAFLLTAMYHPFFTTSYMMGIIVFLSIISIGETRVEIVGRRSQEHRSSEAC